VVAAGDGATAVAADKAAEDMNIFDQYVHLIQTLIVSLHESLTSSGVPYAYGVAIFLFTMGVKVLVLPLNWKQMEGTVAMQKLQPRTAKLQKWFGENQQALALETSELYKSNKVNPLAGCLPSLAQIPIFIGLYRAITGLSKDQVLSESFLWLPSLEVRRCTRRPARPPSSPSPPPPLLSRAQAQTDRTSATFPAHALSARRAR
jgi:YidC/Oxa1 family membrane protein insertase